jgi:HEAT repeat protein
LQGTAGVDQIIWQLVACHERSVPFLVDRLREIKGPQINEIPHLIRDLDSDRFTVRSSATRELELFGDLAEPALLQTLQKHPSLEVQRRIEVLLERVKQKTLPAPPLRVLRALEAIEQAPASVACQALESLSTRAASDWVRQEARSSLRRFLVKRD